MVVTFQILLFMLLSLCLGMKSVPYPQKTYSTTPLNLEILAIYEMNSKVWGTYKLDKEYIYQVENKEKTLLKKNINQFIQESLLFEKNKLFLIHNGSNDKNRGKLLIKSFSYISHKSGLTIELYKNKNDYFDLNYAKLNEILSTMATDTKTTLNGPDYLHVGNMDCKKTYHRYICKTSITISVI